MVTFRYLQATYYILFTPNSISHIHTAHMQYIVISMSRHMCDAAVVAVVVEQL
jgi:hypothetical protein